MEDTPSRNGKNKQYIIPLFVLAIYFILNVLVVGLQGDFPLNDDWMYGSEVRIMLETGKLSLLGGGPACAFHILTGAALCKLFGFSFTVLRVLSIFAGALAALLMFLVLRELRLGLYESLLGTLVLATNPLFENLIFCYMTDVPALAYSLIYLLFLLKTVSNPSHKNMLCACVGLSLAIQVRQNSAVLLAAGVLLIFLVPVAKKLQIKAFAYLVALPALSAYLAEQMMKWANRFPGAYDWYKTEIARLLNPINLPVTFGLEFESMTRAIAYLGLFCAPIILRLGAERIKNNGISSCDDITAHESTGSDDDTTSDDNINPVVLLSKPRSKERLVIVALSLILTTSGFGWLTVHDQALMPFSKNLLLIPQLGPYTLLGGKIPTPTTLQIILTFCSFLFAILYLAPILDIFSSAAAFVIKDIKLGRLKQKQIPGAKLYRQKCCQAIIAFACFIAVSLAIFHTSIANLDRYLLLGFALSIPPLLLAIRRSTSGFWSMLPLILTALIGGYSIAAQHDYLHWNRARWQAISDLQKRDIPFALIDGGTEFNYMHNPALSNNLALGPNLFESTHKGSSSLANERAWSVDGEEYLISLKPIPGYDEEYIYPYSSFLEFKKGSVYVLHKANEAR